VARRFSPAKYRLVYAALVERDGEYCSAGLWGVEGEEACAFGEGERPQLQIDHVKERDECGPEEYEQLGNYRLLCRSCNARKEHRRRARRIAAEVMSRVSPPDRVCVREGAESFGGVPTSNIRQHLGSEEQGPHLRKNSLMEPVYRDYVLTAVLRGRLQVPQVVYSKKELNDAGAEACQGNPATTVRYLDKLVSMSGVLRLESDGLGGTVVLLREDPYPS